MAGQPPHRRQVSQCEHNPVAKQPGGRGEADTRTGRVGAEEQVALPEGQQRGEADHLARRLPFAQRVHLHCLPWCEAATSWPLLRRSTLISLGVAYPTVCGQMGTLDGVASDAFYGETGTKWRSYLVRAPGGGRRPLAQGAHRDLAPDDDEDGDHHGGAADGRRRAAGQQHQRRGHHELVRDGVQECPELRARVPLHPARQVTTSRDSSNDTAVFMEQQAPPQGKQCLFEQHLRQDPGNELRASEVGSKACWEQ